MFVCGFGTKIDAIVFDIVSHLKQDAALAALRARSRKSLVFSQFADVLVLVGRALAANGVKFLHLKHHGVATSTTVAQFKSDTSVPVLLLPLKTGNHGMSLAEAQRVFIVEPCLIPAIEAQATARVRRLDQTEKTFVHRYAVAGSVEQMISRAMMPRLQQLEQKFGAAPSLSAAAWSHPLTHHELYLMFQVEDAGGSDAQAEDGRTASDRGRELAQNKLTQKRPAPKKPARKKTPGGKSGKTAASDQGLRSRSAWVLAHGELRSDDSSDSDFEEDGDEDGDEESDSDF